jgi:hypothetical protein
MSDHAKPGRPRIFGRSHGIHSDDPLFEDPPVVLRAEPVERIEPVEQTMIIDDADWKPAGHHRGKIIASGLTMGALAVIMGWSFVSIFGSHAVDHATAYAAPSASTPSTADPSVPVTMIPTSPGQPSPVPAPAAVVKPLSAPQSQDLRGLTQPGRPTLDHDADAYPGLARRYLVTPTPRPTHRPPTTPPTPSPSTSSPNPPPTTQPVIPPPTTQPVIPPPDPSASTTPTPTPTP